MFELFDFFSDLIIKFNAVFTILFGGSVSALVWKWREASANKKMAIEAAMRERENRIGRTEQGLKDLDFKVTTTFLTLLHDRIYTMGYEYLKQGYVTWSEFENYQKLWETYSKMGGNGTGEEMFNSVAKLGKRFDNLDSANDVENLAMHKVQKKEHN